MEAYDRLLEQEEEYADKQRAAVKAAKAAAEAAGETYEPADDKKGPDFDKMKKRLQRQFRAIPLELQRLFTQLQYLQTVRAECKHGAPRAQLRCSPRWHAAVGGVHAAVDAQGVPVEKQRRLGAA